MPRKAIDENRCTDNFEIVQIQVDPGEPYKKHSAKMTRRKRIEFLNEFGKDYNITRAAHRVGVTRETIMRLKRVDEKFAAAFNKIKDAYLDAVESACFSVALHANPRAFRDRQLLLSSHRPERYASKVNINQKVTIDAKVIKADLNDLLRRFSPAAKENRAINVEAEVVG